MPAGPRATAESLPIADVELDDDFWTPRVETNREVTIVHQYDQLDENFGAVDVSLSDEQWGRIDAVVDV